MQLENNIKKILERAKEDGQDIQNITWKDCEEENLKIQKIEISNSLFWNCRCIESDFSRSHFTNVTFENCDFSNTNFSETEFTEVKFVNCKMIGCNFTDSSIYKNIIEQSNFEYANFSNSIIKSTRLLEVNLRGAALGECKLKKTNGMTAI